MTPPKLKKITYAIAAGISLATAGSALATTYDTTPSWNGSSSIQPFGKSDTATYGQTFVAPSDSILDDFTFYLSGRATLQFQAEVYAWSGSLLGGGGGGATGPALFTSAPITLGPTVGFQAVTVNTGGLLLTPGADYVALFTVSGPDASDYTNSNGTDVWGRITSHVAGDGGGGFVFYNNGNNYGALNSSAWDNFADFGDSAWIANFHAPEPGTLALLGLAGIGLFRRRQQS
ncbi:MAG TPA: PEP-CTERM sorting domain-containing protein [Accumulibacter sp.]|uniref:PEP-CTERM sorting domain-containing protein n=1 Tax=Accumulibacter sp. TaxID=2053492 RepID=UPI0025F647BB|nr:PEP-CTERM sorting domain-containing protein [Accumulibacter sp.]MCM8664151.1 PEP-CTERM sorting domain-containing protein [Accumulibacter sp.]HNC53518.1 PEP-CTERM sorting domain-containing protein [Accumulibacter sp.]